MTREEQDIQRALFGSPLGAFEALFGLFLILSTPVLLMVYAISRRPRRKGRHAAS